MIVVDDFVPDPDRLRQSALESGFGTWKPKQGEVGSSIYDGMNFWGDHGMAIRALTEVCGRSILPNSMFFRVTNENTEPAYIHSDREMGQYTVILYLSKHDERSGTGFYRHRVRDEIIMDSFTQMRDDPETLDRLKIEMVEGKPDIWECYEFVPGIYNRALIFTAPLFHSRYPRNGFGTTPEDGRMVWVCHYDL